MVEEVEMSILHRHTLVLYAWKDNSRFWCGEEELLAAERITVLARLLLTRPFGYGGEEQVCRGLWPWVWHLETPTLTPTPTPSCTTMCTDALIRLPLIRQALVEYV